MMNTELILMRGLPASGKTTYAKELVAKSKGSLKRINRDSLREMVDNGVWSKDNEKLIVEVEKELFRIFVLNGKSVVVDDCNLPDSLVEKWRDAATYLECGFEVIDFRDVPLQECISRDQKRPNYVGEKVIKKMYNQFLAKKLPEIDLNSCLPPAWIFDIDGTLAIHKHRSPYQYELCESDIVNESVRAIMNNIRAPRHIFLLSGRPDTYREQTERWLRTNEIEYTTLYMRKGDDKRSDDIVKRELYEENIHGKFQVIGIFDDRLRVCRLWSNLGLPVFKCGDPDADF